MALVDNVWYVDFGNGSSTGYYAVAAWSNHTAVAGELIRQLTAPTVGNERCFICTTAGATGAVEPTWTNTRGALNTSSSAIYQECTGIAALNGDATNTPSWTITAIPPGGVKNTAVTLGQVIKRDNGASYQICTIAGTAGNGAEPGFSDTAGTTTADNTVTWTSLGVVGNFTGWQAPHARLTNAYTATWGQAGNSFFVASEYNESLAAGMTITPPGTAASPNFTYCVTKTNVPPTSANLTTGASVATSTSNTITWGAGFGYFYGMAFKSGSGANPTVHNITPSGSSWFRFDSCSLTAPGTSASTAKVLFGATVTARQRFELVNTTIAMGNTSDGIAMRNGELIWKNTAAAIATAQTTLFTSSNALPGQVLLEGIDLSALGSGSTIVGALAAARKFILKDCKLGASVTIATTPTDQGGPETHVIRSDSSGTNYRHEKYRYEGIQTVETIIVRTGGASDGTTPLSWKIVSTANSKWVLPFECIPITVWCETTGSHTVTVYGTTTGGGVPNNDDIWITAEYLKDSGDPLGGFVTTTKSDNLAASVTTNNSSDASTWGGGGAGNGFKMVTSSFTVNQKGPITVYVYVAKATTTYYVDSRPAISGITVNRSLILAPGVYANELGGGSGSFSYIS